MTDGAQSPELSELSGHLRRMAHRLWAYMSAYISKDRKGGCDYLGCTGKYGTLGMMRLV